ncbi:MAG: Dibenzothiophene desulfurization enzyme [Frankiales bacterium]|nr:Dibenzothiophene desulfurization enzyme [Frankiales bacterium]
MTSVVDSVDILANARRVGADVAGPHAADVDRLARFPVETIEALREARLMSALVPVEFGGAGASFRTVAEIVTALARHCSSSALIYAMHQSQVACLVRHREQDSVKEMLRRVAAGQLLIASATTEIGIGGDVRSSTCFVERSGDRFLLRKQAPVISYGAFADLVLTTARRDGDSAPHDQVLVMCPAEGLVLEQTGPWDTLGFRGTCSNGYLLTAEGDLSLVMSEPYADISAQTMLPAAHLFWGSAWLGIAEESADRARRYVQAAARAKLGTTPPGALRLAEMFAVLQQMRDLVDGALRRFESMADDREALSGAAVTVALNSLKVAASTLLVDIVGRALVICGISGYREDTPYTLGRLLRDAFGAQLMVNNDRISHHNAQLLLVAKDA